MSKADKLALLSSAHAALAKASTIPEVKRVIDMAAAARAYAKEAKLSKEAVDYATEIKIRAERKLGLLLKETERAAGTRGQIQRGRGRGQPPVVAVASKDRQQAPPTLRDLGVSKDQSSRAQKLAAMPAKTFERAVTEAKRGGDLSVARVLVDERRREKHAGIAKTAKTSAKVTGVYSVILADPPWRYSNESSSSRRVSNQYPCMPTDEICALRVPAADAAALYLWVTAPHLPDGLRVVEAWGFAYKTCAVWVKPSIGPGWWVRERHELLLVGARGNMPPPLPAGRSDSVICAARGKHSEKPAEVYELIERAYPGLPKIELFARKAREGWDRWGLEA